MKTLEFQAAVLAAGKGKRMGSDLPKVLLPLCGRPIICHVLSLLAEVGIRRPVIVISREGDAIRETLGDDYSYVVQGEQLGSGHAVLCAREAAQGAKNIIVMCGDSPLFRVETIRSLMREHVRHQATITLTSAILDDPAGYGRILRNPSGEVSGIIEEKMASDEQKSIEEINGGCYGFDAEWLWGNIGLMTRNEAGEYCLTEMVDIAIRQGRKVITVSSGQDEVAGINTPAHLKQAERMLCSKQ
ncbi:MAG TPA: NTP transferase domain-containing protein [Armatimonadota bacterium]|nr:NTP transferase domain-containing protein [Armatimonadota bacterium]